MRRICRFVRAVAAGVLLAGVAAGSAGAQGRSPEPGYMDDRSTPESVINSYYNAVNLREYARAYSYWEPAAADRELPDFTDFANGYTDTASVDVTLGDGTQGVGAGQLFFTEPVTLVATMNDGSVQTFVGCYRLHLSRPQIQAVPPFRPLGIQHANITQVDNDADTADLMAQACQPV